ncbi:MAG: response regulator [Deltaproteobacteria bacterium]|nr:response regulator [Deltaproteobacteria bacterium]
MPHSRDGALKADVLRSADPDVIILDLLMPSLSGFDVVDVLQAEPATARIPVVLLTAKDLTAADRAKLDGHVMAILQKSECRGDSLRTEIRRAMSPGRRGI